MVEESDSEDEEESDNAEDSETEDDREQDSQDEQSDVENDSEDEEAWKVLSIRATLGLHQLEVWANTTLKLYYKL